MKKISCLLTSIVLLYSGYAQQLKEPDLPAPVKATFASIYPLARDVNWEKEDDRYEAGFKQNKTGITVLPDATGSLLQTETEITVSSLPKKVLDYVLKNFSGKNIKEASKIIDSAATVTYEAELGGTDYLFDANGNFIKTETSDLEENEED